MSEEEPDAIAWERQRLEALRFALGREGSSAAAGRLPQVSPSVTRYYATTCADIPGTGAELQILAIPLPAELVARRQIDPESLSTDVLAQRFNAHLNLVYEQSIGPDLLTAAILATRLDQGGSGSATLDQYAVARQTLHEDDGLVRLRNLVQEHYPELYLFVSRLLVEPLVPVEGSPPRGTSIAQLFLGAGGIATVGYAFSGSPVLILATPVAMIVLGGARGIAAGLEEGLHRRIVTWLTGTDPGPRQPTEITDAPGTASPED